MKRLLEFGGAFTDQSSSSVPLITVQLVPISPAHTFKDRFVARAQVSLSQISLRADSTKHYAAMFRDNGSP